MSQTITVPNDLYDRLEAAARARNLNIAHLLAEWEERESELSNRQNAVRRIDELRERILAQHGEMPDSTKLVSEDRAR